MDTDFWAGFHKEASAMGVGETIAGVARKGANTVMEHSRQFAKGMTGEAGKGLVSGTAAHTPLPPVLKGQAFQPQVSARASLVNGNTQFSRPTPNPVRKAIDPVGGATPGRQALMTKNPPRRGYNPQAPMATRMTGETNFSNAPTSYTASRRAETPARTALRTVPQRGNPAAAVLKPAAGAQGPGFLARAAKTPYRTAAAVGIGALGVNAVMNNGNQQDAYSGQ
jgi:hypothetical protein